MTDACCVGTVDGCEGELIAVVAMGVFVARDGRTHCCLQQLQLATIQQSISREQDMLYVIHKGEGGFVRTMV